jgi:GDPmannose 4,6-dehydratase
VFSVIQKVKPTEIYNLCAQSHVQIGAEMENYTFQTNTIGILNILQSVRSITPKIKVYQASTSEEFGNGISDVGVTILDENSPKKPVSVYGISKLAAEQLCIMYREAFGMFVVSSTLFNHSGPRRGHNFVGQKIARYVGKQDYTTPLQLGNINAKRDIGHSRDYTRAIYMCMQQASPVDYVIATGETHSIREIVEIAFSVVNVSISWQNTGVDEIGVCSKTGKVMVQVNPRYFRDIDIEVLIGDASKAKKILGWEPEVSFTELITEMVNCAKNT